MSLFKGKQFADKPHSQMPRRRGRASVAWALGIAVLLLLLSPVLLVETVWDGRFLLTLDISSGSGTTIKELSYATFFWQNEAEWVKTHHGMEADSCFRPATEKDGQFIAEVPCSGRTWMNVERKYTEMKYIVLRIKQDNGIEVQLLAEMPKGRGNRRLTVTVP